MMKLSSFLLTFLLLSIAWTTAVVIAKENASEEESFGEGGGDGLGTIIGIDLGTTYSCVGVMQSGRVEIIANDQGNRITPSYVAFTSGDERLIGDAAKNQATLNPENTIFDVKRLIGRNYHDKSVQADKKLVPYDVVNVDDRPFVEVSQDNAKVRFAPEEVSAMILQKMKVTAETFLGKSVHRAVVTVPAYFNDAQRHATKDAGIIAGLQVERIINEPTAAAIAYGMDKTEEANILVFDLGGGTFDVTILSIDAGIFQVLSTNGDTHLGGADFDQRIIQHFTSVLKKRSGVDISKNKRALQKLRKEAERVKRALSTSFQARVDIEDLVEGVDLSEVLTRAKFEELNADLFRKTLEPVKLAMEDAMLEVDEIDEIVLVGGSTRIPKVQALIQEFFDGKEPNSGVNPDEAVAYGAAVQGSILSGEGGGDASKSILLLDATPLSLGTVIVGGVMSVLIKRGSTIPTEKSGEYVTTEDYQTKMTIDVYEGERTMVEDNHLLGLFEMTGLPPLPRGQAKVLVTFSVDANGILEVTAEDRATKNQKKIVITPESGRLSEADIARMVQEAEDNAEKDRIARDRIEARNALESYVYGLLNTLRDNESKLIEYVGAETLKELEDAIDETMEWLENNQNADEEDFSSKRQDLNSLSGPIFSKLYAEGGGSNSRDDFDDEL